MNDSFKQASGVISTEVSPDEVVILDLEAGEYFGLEGPAARLWPKLVEAQNLDSLTSFLRAKYPDSPSNLDSEIQSLLEAMVEKKLITSTPEEVSFAEGTAETLSWPGAQSLAIKELAVAATAAGFADPKQEDMFYTDS